MVKLRIENEDLEDLEDQKRSLSARLTQERGKVRQMDDLISLSGMSLYSENGLMLNQVRLQFLLSVGGGRGMSWAIFITAMSLAF